MSAFSLEMSGSFKRKFYQQRDVFFCTNTVQTAAENIQAAGRNTLSLMLFDMTRSQEVRGPAQVLGAAPKLKRRDDNWAFWGKRLDESPELGEGSQNNQPPQGPDSRRTER